MNNITIRRAVAEDADILTEMEQKCFTDPWDRRTFAGLLSNPTTIFTIAEIDGNPVAYGGMTVIIDECEILNIAVSPEMRRMGIGNIMVRHMLDICRSCNVATVFLEHRESNHAAATLYESFGFMPYAIRRKYYSSPVEDAVLRNLKL